MSKTPYETLGLDKTALEADIKKAYRKLAKSLHPDLNPGDSEAEERFKQVSAAFAIIGDPKKRAAYDSGEIDETGAERPKHQYYRQHADTDARHQYHTTAGFEDFADLSDLFGGIYGQSARGRAGPMAGANVRYHLKVGFLEAAKGATKRITMPDGKTLDVTIPRGVAGGGVIRLKGKGRPGPANAPPGDALIEVEVEPHPFFQRNGLDILIDLPITIDEAVLGGKVEVPTIGSAVSMTLPKGVSSGRIMRLKGRGIHDRGGKRKGDQLVRLTIVLPDEIDEELETLMSKWKSSHPYDPRKTIKGAP